MLLSSALQVQSSGRRWYSVLTMDRNDLPQLIRETLGAVLMIAGLVAATHFLFAL